MCDKDVENLSFGCTFVHWLFCDEGQLEVHLCHTLTEYL